MLAPKEIPLAYQQWNQEHAAPFGASWWRTLLETRYIGRFSYSCAPGRIAWQRRASLPKWLLRRIGPFGFQANSRTRIFEYPWCFFSSSLKEGLKILDIGSGAAGFQFLLSEKGIDVTSVDPMVNPSETVQWTLTDDEFRRLNEAYGGKISFVRSYLESANLEPEQFDRAIAVSVLEHLSMEDCISLVREVRRVLKPGGLFVATVDLFLDCKPFADSERNKYGTNVDLQRIIGESGMSLKVGTPAELHGFPDFDAQRILQGLDSYLCEGKTLSQCVVLEKPA